MNLPAAAQSRTGKPPIVVRQYRCRQCKKLLFEAVRVRNLVKRCRRCKTQNVFDDFAEPLA